MHVDRNRGRTGMVFAWDGCQSGSNLSLSITVVYEWLPLLADSIPKPVSGTYSRNSIEQVRNALTVGGKWVWEHGPAVLDAFLSANSS
jgi:hypothetical protein